MPLFDYRAITINRAFILNAVAAALIALATVEIRLMLERNKDMTNDFFNIIITLISAIIAALIIYWIMYFIVGFGGGMIADPQKPKVI